MHDLNSDKMKGFGLPILSIIMARVAPCLVLILVLALLGEVKDAAGGQPTFSDKFKHRTLTLFRSVMEFFSHGSLAFQPNLDFRKESVHVGVKEAAEKSVEVSQDAMEESARSAAEKTIEAVEKAKDTMKRSLIRKNEEKENPFGRDEL